MRYTSNGTLDPAFSGDGIATFGFESGSNDVLKAMAFDSKGRAVVAGTSNGLFAVAGVVADAAVVRAPFDFDGDGKSDIGIYRPSGGQWWITRSSTNITVAAQFGSSTDKIVPGDFTGDGKSDMAFFGPSNGFWYVLRSEDFTYYGFPFGTSGDLPTPGDYDGDGKMDAAVFSSSNSGWYQLRTTQGLTAVTFGLSSDVPVQTAFIP